MRKLYWLFATVLLAGLFLQTKCKGKNCKPNPKPDCICTMQYDPVCGCDGKTYGNACEAACAGVDVVEKGECPGK